MPPQAEEPADAGDHATPAELIDLYIALEDAGVVTPGDERSVAEQCRAAGL